MYVHIHNSDLNEEHNIRVKHTKHHEFSVSTTLATYHLIFRRAHDPISSHLKRHFFAVRAFRFGTTAILHLRIGWF
jgi:hypothetical protein